MMNDRFTITITTTREKALEVAMKLRGIGIEDFMIDDTMAKIRRMCTKCKTMSPRCKYCCQELEIGQDAHECVEGVHVCHSCLTKQKGNTVEIKSKSFIVVEHHGQFRGEENIENISGISHIFVGTDSFQLISGKDGKMTQKTIPISWVNEIRLKEVTP